MSEVFLAVPAAMDAYAATHHGAAATISAAASLNAEEMLATVAAALGPIGAGYLAAYALAQANHLTATSQLALVHAGLGDTITALEHAFIAADHSPIRAAAAAPAHTFAAPDNT